MRESTQTRIAGVLDSSHYHCIGLKFEPIPYQYNQVHTYTPMILSRQLLSISLSLISYGKRNTMSKRTITTTSTGGSNNNNTTAKKQKQASLSGFFSSKTTATTEPKVKIPPFKIFCDLDGVLVDFDAGVRNLFHGKGPDAIPIGTMWGAIHNASPPFYEYAPWMSDGKRLWNAILPLSPDILTGVPMSRKSRAEKALWCARELTLTATLDGVSATTTHHVDMAGSKSSHTVVQGRRKRNNIDKNNNRVVNVITCWSKNKHLESFQKDGQRA